jgi:hypothetical protein
MIPRDELCAMPAPEFAHFGVEQVAFVKRTVVDGAVIYEIRAADGTQLGVARSRDAAIAAIHQNGLDATSVQ